MFGQTLFRTSAVLLAAWIGLFSMEALSVYAEEELCRPLEKEQERRAENKGFVNPWEDETADVWNRKKSDKDPTGQKAKMLIPGGMPFGVRFYTDGAMICRVEPGSPAAQAGLTEGDLICAINDRKIRDAVGLTEALEQIGTEKVTVEFYREGKKKRISAHVDPQCADRSKLGVYVRDSLAGIGTLTFYDPESGMFGGLGHGICQNNSGTLLRLGHGSITGVRVTSVVMGVKGTPGQLRGLFCPGNRGEVKKNTEQGIFGVCDRKYVDAEPVAVADAEQVKEGKAQILCTVRDGAPQCYEVEIEKILSFDPAGKNYLVKVTDEKLLALTGGIVQGMSGSPILQNGRIVGAVTHVLVEDPTRGYGIYIGNMLDNMS